MASGESRQFWDGRVEYNEAGSKVGEEAGELVSLSNAKNRFLHGSGNLRIRQIEIYGYCWIQILDFTIFKYFMSKPDHYLAMVMTADEKWWSFRFEQDCSVLCIARHSDYRGHGTAVLQHTISPVYDLYPVMIGSWFIKNDESNSNVNQLFRWLDQKSRPGNQFESSENFAKEIFNKLARIKTWERLQGIVRSPWKQKGGSEWLGTIRYINPDGRADFEDDRIAELRNKVDPDRSCMIIRVKVYKIPLSEKYWTNMLLFHSYVVFQTRSTDGETWWWSLEKNSQCIALQRGPTEPNVRDLLGGEKRCLSWFYWRPQLINEDTCSDYSLADLIDFLHDNDELNITYHGTTENCQCLARVVFNRLTNRELNYGLLAEGAAAVNRYVTGNTDPRPRDL